MKKLFPIILIFTLFSCSTTRREIKKDEAATSRVLSKSDLTDIVGKVYNARHPISQQPIYIKGKDSIIEVPIVVDVVRDSIIKTECPNLNLDSLKAALTRTVWKFRTDTLKVPDIATIRLLNEEYVSHAATVGKLTVITQDNVVLKKEVSKKTMWIYIIGFGALVIIGGLIFLLFKK